MREDLHAQSNYITNLEVNFGKTSRVKKNHRAVKNDAIDKALAMALNSRPEMAVKFKRESCGVYNFGTKRVSVRLDLKDRLSVRVGGGSITLEQFLDTYTQSELVR